ncbi:ankyrin repeat domain-containing protein [Ferrimonas sediminicola]|uniref:Ankyrin repeat domain-containing protein n=1 Tax=Ferrimonas sediminicola TaxID=2569538 RepID=A0A4U1BLK0_9GAMM|nr:ankyrin repeat domain-containing protein [Ferrimonas sediminicola]TKB50978.1 ankyrin repeat domain-containing protein [Ferrimonas sediminicola]
MLKHITLLTCILVFLNIAACERLSGEPSVFSYIKNGKLEEVKEKVEEKGVFESLNSSGVTPLIYSIEENNFDAFNLLLESGANPNFKIASGGSAVTFSVINDNPDYLRTLIKYGANVDTFHEERKRNVIFDALSPNKIEHLKALVSAGAEVNVRDGVNQTPLIVAANLNQYEVVLFLLENGANPDLTDNFGNKLSSVLESNVKFESESMAKIKLKILPFLE